MSGCRSDGRADAGQRADSRGDDGDGGRVRRGALAHSFAHAPTACGLAIVGWRRAFSGAIGLVQRTLEVLAYSTVSQLGYMFLACGVGAFSAGIFSLDGACIFQGLLLFLRQAA